MKNNQEHQEISLKDQVGHILEEARMILPGIQALFGFQMIVVFNDHFVELPMYVQYCHVFALALVVGSIALVILPAAYNRMAQPAVVTLCAVKLFSRVVCYALLPLAAGIALDLFVVLHIIVPDLAVTASMAVVSFLLLVGIWFGYPLWIRHKQRNDPAGLD